MSSEPAADSSAIDAYNRGSTFDNEGDPERAVPLYREALELGLQPHYRRQATIQLASSLRNLGQAEEGAELLRAELSRDDSDEFEDALAGFLALTLADSGSEREALGFALTALAGHMDRYSRSLRNYASEL